MFKKVILFGLVTMFIYFNGFAGELKKIDGKYYDMREIRVDDFRQALLIERQQLVARIAEIDAKIASMDAVQEQTLSTKPQ